MKVPRDQPTRRNPSVTYKHAIALEDRKLHPGMRIIPAIDLLGGRVVHAHRGQRHLYAPIRSSLCHSSNPVVVVTSLLALYPFRIIYVADLDAIQGRGSNLATIQRLVDRFEALAFWCDAGLEATADRRGWTDRKRWRPVIGSEGLESVAMLESLVAAQRDPPLVLSLDYMRDRLKGPEDLLHRTDLWPQEVIVMSLDYVGSGRGPDYGRLQTVRALCPGRHLFAAGGVRYRDDLTALADLGIAGALVATALHDGRIGPEAILACSG